MNLLSPDELNTSGNGDQALNSVLIGDTFLVDRMSPSFFVNPLSESVSNTTSSLDEEIMNMMNSSMELRKPLEMFDEQMMLAPPAPPPLDDNDINGTLLGFDGDSLSGKAVAIDASDNEKISFSPPSLVSNEFLESGDLFECNLFDNNENRSDSDNSFVWSE